MTKQFKNFPHALLLVLLAFGFTACFDDLDTTPIDPDSTTAEVVYDDADAYEGVLAKLYAGLAVSGQQGPAGQADISGSDEGFSTYLRSYWKLQELSTDEAVVAWNDDGIKDFQNQNWTASNQFITLTYNRIFYQISLANEFIRETTEEKIAERGQTDRAEEIETFRAEARFLRALSYWHALDLFRNVPFVTEEDAVGAFFPEQIQAPELFEYVESELLDIEEDMVDARANEYGRADKAAVWTLLAKMYLNAEAHIGTDRYTDAVEYSRRVIDAGYELEPEYENLYVADNDQSPESIFPILFDGVNTRTWGGMTFIAHAAVGGNMNPMEYGLDAGWGGTRTTSALVEKFPSTSGGGEIVQAPIEPDPDAEFDFLNVPGAYQNWDPANNSTALVRRGDENVYDGFIHFAEGLASYEFKFAFGGWDNNLGLTAAMDNNLEQGGGNLTAPEPGFYRIVVNVDELTYELTKMEFGIIGSATPTGWDGDTDMTFDTATGEWSITLPLTGGQEFKFRANDAWDFDFGDNDADGVLDPGGANIGIARDGLYKVSIFLTGPVLTYAIEVPSSDSRAMFYTDGQSLEITDASDFTQGYAVTKFRNVTRDGVVGSDLTFPDTDFMLFRLGDVYLMYAEAVLRGGSGGSIDEAIGYVNELRERAYGNEAGNIQRSDLDLDFILDERARELYWEAHRRTDLVRFGQFTDGDYVWPLKGGTLEGTQVPAFRDVFPIPANDIGANPNLTQNTGY